MRAIDIERAVTPYLGEAKSIKDVEAARQSLEKLYHQHGYQTVLVNIPQQESQQRRRALGGRGSSGGPG
jgi:hemolysin activation/secretion protein